MSGVVSMSQRADGSYFVGSARGERLERRLGEDRAGTYPGDTSRLRPVTAVYAERFGRITDAGQAERRTKGWGRAEEALIRGDGDQIQTLAKRPTAQASSKQSPSS